MKAKIFSLHYDWQRGQLNDDDLQSFQEKRQIVSVTDHFFANNGEPMIFVVVTYRDTEDTMPLPKPEKYHPRNRDSLSDADRPLFDALRMWRNNKARASGVPNFVLFSNKQLGQISELRPTSLKQLGSIHGIGESRLESHGREILEIVSGMSGVCVDPADGGLRHE